jgi:hypothetical protein
MSSLRVLPLLPARRGRALAGCTPGAVSTKLRGGVRCGHADYLERNYNRILVRGSYAVEDGTVKVKTADGEKATRLMGTNAIWAARRLLRELAAEGKA